MLPELKTQNQPEAEAEEVSTVIGAKVRVTSGGDVQLIPDESAADELTADEEDSSVSEKPTRKGKKKEQVKKNVNKNGEGAKKGQQKLTSLGKPLLSAKFQKTKKRKLSESAADEPVQKAEELVAGKRKRDLEPDFFSDTTADSELSDTEDQEAMDTKPKSAKIQKVNKYKKGKQKPKRK